MTNCFETIDLGKERLTEAIHPYDFICRPQILVKNVNNDYNDLIERFAKLTNIYGVLNATLNIHLHPIARDEKEAINIFLKTDLDSLLLENYFIKKIR